MLLQIHFIYVSYVAFYLVRGTKSENQTLTVICPPFKENDFVITPPGFSVLKPSIIKLKSTTDYCACTLNINTSGKTAIVKCDFEFKESILLTEELFVFKKWNVSSAYVRMTNARSASVSAKFLSSLMDVPSSAFDLWHCGQVDIESTPALLPTQHFTDFKTFIGAGLIDCNLKELPPYFLRDRSRGALRLKDCNIGTVKPFLLHNIDEIRYMIVEDTKVGKVESPLSSSGSITLSRKEIHSWDGMELLNATFEHIASFAFNITHKDDPEKFSVKNCHFTNLDKKAISVSGEINVNISNSIFNQMDSLAIQVNVSVNGSLFFSGNMMEMVKHDSFMGFSCKHNSTLINNTVYIQQSEHNGPIFRKECGNPKMSYVVMSYKSDGLTGAATSSVIVIILVITSIITGVSYWGWRNRMLFQFHYKRNDVPLCPEDTSIDGGEEESSTSRECSTTIQNPTFCPQRSN